MLFGLARLSAPQCLKTETAISKVPEHFPMCLHHNDPYLCTKLVFCWSPVCMMYE